MTLEDDAVLNKDDVAEMLLQRGAYLRRLRVLEMQDEAARRSFYDHPAPQPLQIAPSLPTGDRVLQYESAFLLHQQYYDDLKHVDYKYIDYGVVHGGGSLVIEQDKHLGKGGICWDAAFVLGEHLIATADQWRRKASTATTAEPSSSGMETPGTIAAGRPIPSAAFFLTTRVIELGAGTGLCGLMVGKAVPDVHVTLTDLPPLMQLLRRNVSRNFQPQPFATAKPTENAATPMVNSTNTSESCSDDYDSGDEIYQHYWKGRDRAHHQRSLGTVAAFALQWGDRLDATFNKDGHFFDLVIGADVVASIYDVTALVESICNLSTSATLVLVSFKERLSSVHRQFEDAMADQFYDVEVISPIGSRNRNPDIRILVAARKKGS